LGIPSFVKLVEVGPRDGLQNESKTLTSQLRIELIDRLSGSGLRVVEAGAFVSPKWVPQMANTAEVLSGITRNPGTSYPVLVPNMKGFESAFAAGANEIAVFGAASETFSQKNINCSIKESLSRFEAVIAAAKTNNIKIRGYVSCVLGCPYEGEVSIETVVKTATQLYEMGCYEVSLGDTIGTGTPLKARKMIRAVAESIPVEKLAVHFHDTYGQALANIFAALEEGVSVVDSSVGGLGGCPYAKGASGNVATEDVLYMLEGMGIETGVDSTSIIETAHWISDRLGKAPQSKTASARI
jgi:hydroxymethylglutaryl-CoA lyase